MREKKVTEAPAEPAKRDGAWARDGRWVPGGYHEGDVDQVVEDMLRWRRTGPSPQQFVEWLKHYPRLELATKMLKAPFIAKMAESPEVDDWGCLTTWVDSDFAAWIQRCGRPLQGHYWNDLGQWVPKGQR